MHDKFSEFNIELVSKELDHFGVIADLFRQIGGDSRDLYSDIKPTSGSWHCFWFLLKMVKFWPKFQKKSEKSRIFLHYFGNPAPKN